MQLKLREENNFLQLTACNCNRFYPVAYDVMRSHGREKTMKPLQKQSEIEFDTIICDNFVIGTILFLVNLSRNNCVILIILLCYVTVS